MVLWKVYPIFVVGKRITQTQNKSEMKNTIANQKRIAKATKVMKLAHSVVEKYRKNGESYRQALSVALAICWKLYNLKEALAEGLVQLTFVKKSTKLETTRTATRVKEIIDPTIKGNGYPSPWYIVKFYQPLEQNWRSCDIHTVLGWEFPSKALLNQAA